MTKSPTSPAPLGVVVAVRIGPENGPSAGFTATTAAVTVVGVLDDTDIGFDPTAVPAPCDRVQPMPAQLQLDAPSSAAPAMWLRIRNIRAGRMGIVFSLEPTTGRDEPRRFTYGGRWAECDDPIWVQLTDGAGKVRINDRTEA